MNHQGQELEVKFYLNDLSALENRLLKLGGRLIQPRILEINLRFDTKNQKLSKTSQTLRLRKDSQARITYKGPGSLHQGARLRRELELIVSDFDTAREFFESLGYHVFVLYEKYRAAYAFDNVEVTLDELPYGNFVEIEGNDGTAIQAAANQLGLKWESRSLDSYLALLDFVRKQKGFTFRDLSFENFANFNITPSDLGLNYADSI